MEKLSRNRLFYLSQRSMSKIGPNAMVSENVKGGEEQW